MTTFNNFGRMPTDYENELLSILLEECAEVQQRVIKMTRFGIDEIQPDQPHDNMVRLSHEVGDLLAVLGKCMEAKLVDHTVVETQKPIKLSKLKKYMRYEEPINDQI